MNRSDLVTLVEAQSIQLEKARAVLSEACEYFDFATDPKSKAAKALANHAKQISTLLYVVDDIILESMPKLDVVRDELHKDVIQERKESNYEVHFSITWRRGA